MPEHSYVEQTEVQKLKNWVLSEMFRGAGYALLFLFAIGVTFGVIWGIGQFLPEDSKNAPPPMPFSQVQILDATA